jgi:hypothetical protein
MRKVIMYRKKKKERKKRKKRRRKMNLVATTFAWQPICNATRAAQTLHLDQFFW